MIGQTLGGYRIVEQIGLGGMATVYKAYEPTTDRYVALKVLSPHLSKTPQFRERFQREAKAIAKLEHLRILPLFAYGEEEGMAYMAIRYLPAGTLTDRIKQGQMSLGEASRLLEQIAGALDYAHACGILHRDVKPSNVLLDAEGNAYLTDFGIAKMVEGTLDLTGGGILGTPTYMSPEQCRGSKELTPASDIYSLGIVLYEMVTGRPPFQAETPVALLYMQLHDPLLPPRQLRLDLPETAEQVIFKALAKEPEARYQTAGAMATAFAQAVAQTTVTSLPPPTGDFAKLSGGSSVSTTPLLADEATLLHQTTPGNIATPPQTRPVWLWPVVLFGIMVIGIALFFGLRGVFSGDGGRVPPTNLNPNSLDEPAVTEVKPCAWDNHGPGLCITSPKEGKPNSILTDANLEFTGFPSWRPDGRQIVFSALKPDQNKDESGLYIVEADGANLVKLPSTGNNTSPAWSPDGEWLAFHSDCDLVIMHPDGSDRKRIWLHPNNDECALRPQWSPDSRWLVFTIVPPGEPAFPLTRRIMLISQDGVTTIPMIDIVYESKNCPLEEVAFSPNGQQVAFFDQDCWPRLISRDSASYPEGEGFGQVSPLNNYPFWWTARVYPQWGGKRQEEIEVAPKAKTVELCEGDRPAQICVRDVDTDQVTPITNNLEFEAILGLAWSPDGRQIIFDAGSDLETQQPDHKLYLINADGSGLKQITQGDNNDTWPAWSPDGLWLAFHRNCDLWLIHPDGAEPKRLVAGSKTFCVEHVAWSSDSRQIVFLNKPTDVQREVGIIGPNGRSPQIVYTFERPLDVWDVAWSPDSQQITCWYDEDGKPKVLLLNADGSGTPRVIEGEDQVPWPWRSDFWPQWSKTE